MKARWCVCRWIQDLQRQVENESDRLEKENVIQKGEHSDWATPIVVVPKTNGIHLCGNFKVTINPNVIPEHYPLPNAEDIFASLNGGNVFSKIDLTHPYQQFEINEASKQYLTINTHKGLYRYQRMPYGVTSAPSIFQSVMDKLLNGIPGVQCYLDDILLCSKSVNEHIVLLDKVLTAVPTLAALRMQRWALILQAYQYDIEYRKSELHANADMLYRQ